MADDTISVSDLKSLLESDTIRKSSPDTVIGNVLAALGLNIDPIDQEEIERIRKEYFQAFTLKRDAWTPFPRGPVNEYVQLVPCKIKKIPEGGRLVADVLINKTDFEQECFDVYIQDLQIRDKSIVVYSLSPLPVDLTLGLKCVDDRNPGVIIRVPDENLY